MTPAERAAEWRRNYPDRERAAKAARKLKDPKKWYAEKRASGQKYAAAHRVELNAKQRASRAQDRAEAIAIYGGRCACPGCHVHHAELLCIDHINGGRCRTSAQIRSWDRRLLSLA
jgi:hypothetical protein